MTVKPPNTINLVLLGSTGKNVLLERLREGLQWEPHASYQDTIFITFPYEDKTFLIEINDPGLAHTGGREMAIRRADGGIIICSEGTSSTTYGQLQQLPALFALRKHVCPVRIVSALDDGDTVSNGVGSSTSEGYSSDVDQAEHIPRRNSIEKMRQKEESGGDTKAENLKNEFGETAELLRVALQELDGRAFLTSMITDIEKGNERQIGRVFSLGRKKSKSPRKEKEEKKETQHKESKVCSIM